MTTEPHGVKERKILMTTEPHGAKERKILIWRYKVLIEFCGHLYKIEFDSTFTKIMAICKIRQRTIESYKS